MEIFGDEFSQGVGVMSGIGALDGLLKLDDIGLRVEGEDPQSEEHDDEEFMVMSVPL